MGNIYFLMIDQHLEDYPGIKKYLCGRIGANPFFGEEAKHALIGFLDEVILPSMTLFGKNLPDVIKVKMLCEDPFEAINFKYSGKVENSCLTPLEVEFPIETGYIELIIETCIKELVESFENQKQDIKQDNIDD